MRLSERCAELLAEVTRLREAVGAAKAVAWCVADPYDDASAVIVERESWAQLRRALAALEAGERK
jgi:aryl-alcohol dehydrogenase-like predicted oxidoreductase